MTAKSKQARFSRAEQFLVSLATSLPQPTPAPGTRDVEAAARGVADYIVRKVAAGDVDSILRVFDGTLRDVGPDARRAKTRKAGAPRPRLDGPIERSAAPTRDEVDPYYWG